MKLITTITPRTRMPAILIIAALGGGASCGDSPDVAKLGTSRLPACTPSTYLSPPCWRTIEVSGQCSPFVDYQGCAGTPDASNPLPFVDQVKFLWVGEHAPQQMLVDSSGPCTYGVCPTGYFCGRFGRCYEDTIDPARVSVLQGAVKIDGAGTPYARVEVVSDPKYGLAPTEWAFDPGEPPPAPTGRYFIAVNAGAPVRLRFTQDGYYPAERTVVPVAGQYVEVPEVELVAATSGTSVSPSSSSWQIVDGTQVQDTWGTRTSRLFIPPNTWWTPGTEACDGTPPTCSGYQSQTACEAVTGCHWSRIGCYAEATSCSGYTSSSTCAAAGCTWTTNAEMSVKEYTVGNDGPKKMPGILPPTSAYTFALEARATRADGVSVSPTFNQPVIIYVENFLDLPGDWAVPAGSYDLSTGMWGGQLDDQNIPLNGRIIEIVDYTSGAANVDVTGDHVADNPPWIPFDERQALHSKYSPQTGKSLWRVPVVHFSPWDFNYGAGLPSGAKPPEPQFDIDNTPDPNCASGSIIECETQVLGESIPIPGTPYALSYRSSRVPGYKPSRTLSIRIPGSSIPSGGAAPVKLTVLFRAGGKEYPAQVVNNPSGDQSFTLTFDGTDVFGRPVNGAVLAVARVGYTYNASYEPTAEFALPPGTTSASGNATRDQITLWKEWRGTVGGLDASKTGLGGWTLDVHKAYSVLGNTLYDGAGGAQTVADVINAVAGKKVDSSECIGGLDQPGSCGNPWALTTGANGVVYMAYPWANNTSQDGQIRAIHPDGSITVEVPSTAGLYEPRAVAAANDGTLFIADKVLNKVLKWDGSSLTTVVGTGNSSPNTGDALCTSVNLNDPRGLAIGPDGALYISDTENNRVRRMDPSGYCKVVGGNGSFGYSQDGVSATSTPLGYPMALAFRTDGSLCVASHFAGSGTTVGRIRCIDTSGIIQTVAGGGTNTGDGFAGTSSAITYPYGLAAGLDGSLYFTEDLSTQRVRRLAPSGIVSTIAGSGSGQSCSGENVPAAGSKLQWPKGVAIDSNGRLLIADSDCGNVRRISSGALALGTGTAGELAVPSRDASEIYVFDETGRHLRTEDARTGKVRFEFAYNTFEVQTGVYQKLLTAVRDKRGSEGTSYDRVTEIYRNSAGVAQHIVAPGFQLTSLTVTNGYLTSLSYPNSLGTYGLTYDSSGNGLLTKLVDPKGGTHTFAYETDGRLKEDRDPATQAAEDGGAINAFRTLTKSVSYAGGSRTSEVTLTTAQNLSTVFSQTDGADGSLTRTTERPDGTSTTAVTAPTGVRTVTNPDGSTATSTPVPDQLFGMAAPTRNDVFTVAGTAAKQLITNVLRERSGGSGGLHDFNVLTVSRTVKKNGSDTGLLYKTEVVKNATPKYIRETSPANRKIKRDLDTHGRVVSIARDHTNPEAGAISLAYDSSGRLTLISQGTSPNDRQTQLEYNSTSGYLEYVRKGTAGSPSQFVTKYVTDDLGRVRQIFRNTTSDGTQFKLDYDSNSNTTSVQIPTGSPSTFRTHSLPHLSTNLLELYNPPAVGGSGTGSVDYGYDLDHRLTLVDWAQANKGYAAVWDTTTGQLDKKQTLGQSPTVLVDHTYGSSGAANGKVTNITAGSVQTSYTYSGVQTGWEGLLFRVGTTWPNSTKNVTFTYDDYLRIGTEAVTDGETVTYGYDADGLVTSAAIGSLGTLSLSCTASGLDPDCRSAQSGRVQKFTLGVVKTILGYDGTFGDLTSLATTCTGSTCEQSGNCNTGGSCFTEALVYESSSSPYSLGRIWKRTDTVRGTSNPQLTYDYDSAARLWKVTPNGQPSAVYTYDASGNQNGNRTSAPGQTLSFDEQDRISTSGYQYDSDGRLTSPNGGTTTYSYDNFGQLTGITLAGNIEVQHTYDGLGRRVTRKKLVNSSLTEERRYLYGKGNRLLAMYDDSGALLQQYVYATGRHVPDAAVIGGVLYRIVSDHLGSARLVLKASDGTVVQETTYDAWGAVTGETASIEKVPFGFAGGLRDLDTGLTLMGARWYDSATGRWISKDPILFRGGDSNLYAYVRNDPVNRIDPSGLQEVPIPAGSFDWLYKLLDVKDDADRAANLMYPDEMHNGRGDAFKHCLGSCEAAQMSSAWISAFMGWSNEKYGNWYGQPIEEEQMDYHNNACGRSYSDRIDQSRMSAPADASNNCWNACWAGVQNQDLVYDIESPGYSGKNPYF